MMLNANKQPGSYTPGRRLYALSKDQLKEAMRDYMVKNGEPIDGPLRVLVREKRDNPYDTDNSGVTIVVMEPAK